jgi:hypothetical protein
MDVPPPWYTVAGETCSGETRRCGGGDVACREQAERDGYVAISNYSFCRRDEVHTVPTMNAVVVLVLCAAAVAAVVVRRRLRARR